MFLINKIAFSLVIGSSINFFDIPAAYNVLCLMCGKMEDACLIHKKIEKKTVVLFDTDIGNDIDDVLALQMLINYDKAGIIDLKAITISKCNPHSISFIDGFCRYNGFYDIPLGYAYNGVTPENNTYLLPTLEAEYKGVKILEPRRNINSDIPEGYVELRKQLASAEDSSVIIIAVGPLTNISRLLLSGPDEYSNMNGVDLVKRKVRFISIMSGEMTSTFPEWNMKMDLPASRVVYDKTPVPLIVNGWEVGNKILYPHKSILNDFGELFANPLTVAYIKYEQMPYDRQCWDLISVYDAVDADKTIYRHSNKGVIHIDDKGLTTFEEREDGLHQYIFIDDKDIERAVEALVNIVTMGTVKPTPVPSP